MEKPTILSKYLGCLQGLAIGDTIGLPVEFMKREEIMQKYGVLGIGRIEPSQFTHLTPEKQHSNIGTYSDDTQMSLAVARGILKSKSSSIEEIMENISREFIEWKNSPENNRSPGLTSMEGVSNLDAGIPWRSSGVRGSMGCGAAMRTAPIGLAFYNDLDKLKEIATASAISTHNSKVAIASAIANAYLVSRGIRNEDYRTSVMDLLNFTKGISPAFSRKIFQVTEVMDLPPEEALKELGDGWTGHEAVALALYCALKNDFNFKKSILMAANIDGDSDSVASITGGIVGAHKGDEVIQPYFLRPLENRQLLCEIAEQLYSRFGNKKNSKK